MRIQRYISFLYIPFYKKKILLINCCCCNVTQGHSIVTFEGDPLKYKRMRTRGEGSILMRMFTSFLIEHVVHKLLRKNDQIFSLLAI